MSQANTVSVIIAAATKAAADAADSETDRAIATLLKYRQERPGSILLVASLLPLDLPHDDPDRQNPNIITKTTAVAWDDSRTTYQDVAAIAAGVVAAALLDFKTKFDLQSAESEQSMLADIGRLVLAQKLLLNQIDDLSLEVGDDPNG